MARRAESTRCVTLRSHSAAFQVSSSKRKTHRSKSPSTKLSPAPNGTSVKLCGAGGCSRSRQRPDRARLSRSQAVPLALFLFYGLLPRPGTARSSSPFLLQFLPLHFMHHILPLAAPAGLDIVIRVHIAFPAHAQVRWQNIGPDYLMIAFSLSRAVVLSVSDGIHSDANWAVQSDH